MEPENISDVYEVQFEQLVEGEKKPLNSSADIFEAELDITITMGNAREKIGRIVNYKVGDIIELDKHVEETLDINVNEKTIASGESIIMDNKLAVRLSKIKNMNEDI
ncbi:FliM/FliN family flagellar motor switch protein [Asaccharospora irregularis]|uniref:Flagellar motor switch protein FliN/FliY n=1 Tax=Asaccharospora irregularis DSM 2635 TaxID=1121321 RepID=A0A1M5SP84_9FIRM|nr:FliM/FliN family flagellar motor C-terminal domain-containing protein [Asaccharospora irregularis]SHH40310.1 flagellar motor switch protein FliN/FliY [Asaccharospora irregularis DSM 2635]